jgi:uncharacterized damage-inducible protein DinB
MTQLSLFAAELAKEANTTRKMLSIVPMDKLDWAPHKKSMLLGNLVGHIAELPGWINYVLNSDGLDFATMPYTPPVLTDSASLLTLFETSLADGKNQLANGREETLGLVWTLHNGTTIFSATSKAEFIRITLSQVIHHRAQLGVYLRLLDIPIPGSYGPSADDGSFN